MPLQYGLLSGSSTILRLCRPQNDLLTLKIKYKLKGFAESGAIIKPSCCFPLSIPRSGVSSKHVHVSQVTVR